MRYLLTSSILVSALWVSGCSKDTPEIPQDEVVLPLTERTYVVFSPATSQLPIPNDILFASETAGDGTMTAGFDPENPVITGIDALDGNSVIAPIEITFDGSLDANQTLDAASFISASGSVIPNPSQNIFLLPLTYPGGDSLKQAEVNEQSVEIPTFAEAISYQRAAATADVSVLTQLATPSARAELISLDGGVNNVIRITPLKPLLPETKYLVIVTGINDAAGNAVYPSIAYEQFRDPNADLSSYVGSGLEGLLGVRDAIMGWERLALGYFGFRQTVWNTAGVAGPTLTADDILMTLTFTTGGTTSTLQHVAAPQTFFDTSLRTTYKQSAIAKLVSGDYNVMGDNSGLTLVTDIAINSTINVLLTSPTLPGNIPNALYSESIAGAIAAGAGYATIAAGSASAAYIMQVAAAEAAISVHDGDGIDIATEALGTVQALVQTANVIKDPDAPAIGLTDLFPVPAARTSSFFRVDPASDINAGLIAPALVYQGEITLPQFQAAPTSSDGSAIKTASWQADETIGAALDAARGNPGAGLTPPSNKVTYRYPFPTKQGDMTIPITVTMPDEATLGAFGITKPADGWPVVIFQHGITTDRSMPLPMADALAFACVNSTATGPSGAPCYASVAIDLPLHGVEPSGSRVSGLWNVSDPDAVMTPNLPNTPSEGLAERHFNYTADATSTPVPMDYSADLGNSGSLFINLTNFENARDTLRQGVIDLLNLNASIDSMDVNADGVADDLDPSNVYFIGHSLGAIAGIPFMAINNSEASQSSPFSTLPKVKAGVFMTTGGGLPRLLTNSQAFAGSILQGLAAASDSLTQGRSGLESYLNVFQGVMDSVDAVNFAASLSEVNSDTGVLMTEIIGPPSDMVIPNAADTIWGAENAPLNTTLDSGFVINGFPAPLSGTEPLAAQFGAIPTATASSDGDAAVIITRFTEGSHGTPVLAGNTDLDPLTSGAVFTELLSEVVTFFSLDGDVPSSIVVDTSVVE